MPNFVSWVSFSKFQGTVIIQPDGDVMVVVIPEQDRLGLRNDVEFCLSGTRSRRTREALRELAFAMMLDNLESPIPGEPNFANEAAQQHLAFEPSISPKSVFEQLLENETRLALSSGHKWVKRNES